MYVFGCLQSRGGLRDNAVGGWIELRNRLETSITVPNVLDLFATVDACDEARHLVNATLLLVSSSSLATRSLDVTPELYVW